MANHNQRLSIPEAGGAVPSFTTGRLPSVALALAGMLIVYPNPGSASAAVRPGQGAG